MDKKAVFPTPPITPITLSLPINLRSKQPVSGPAAPLSPPYNPYHQSLIGFIGILAILALIGVIGGVRRAASVNPDGQMRSAR